MARDGVSVKVVGLDKAIKDVKKFQFIKREAIRLAVKDTALDVERTAKEFVPVLTGRLKTSIQTDLTALLSGLTFSAMVGSPVLYSKYVEFGTRKMHAQPYLYPAWILGQRDLIMRVAKIMKTPIKTI